MRAFSYILFSSSQWTSLLVRTKSGGNSTRNFLRSLFSLHRRVDVDASADVAAPYAEEFFKITIKSFERLRPKELYGRNIERIARFRRTLFWFCSFAENYSRGGGVGWADERRQCGSSAARSKHIELINRVKKMRFHAEYVNDCLFMNV